jgi:hypothetical protein
MPQLRSHTSQPAAPKYQFDLQSLVRQTKAEAAAEEAVAKARAVLDAPPHAATSDQQTAQRHLDDDDVDDASVGEEEHEKLLASVVDAQGDDAAGLQKIRHAMRRTEALRQLKSWYFFRQASSGEGHDRHAFPHASLPRGGWQAALKGKVPVGVSQFRPPHLPSLASSYIAERGSLRVSFTDAGFRHQAFLTGFVAEMVMAHSTLPDEAVLWVLQERELPRPNAVEFASAHDVGPDLVCLEPRDDMRFAYQVLLEVRVPSSISEPAKELGSVNYYIGLVVIPTNIFVARPTAHR